MDRLKSWLDKRREAGILRELLPVERLGAGKIRLVGQSQAILTDFSSNDYLALSEHPYILSESRRCLEKFGAGAGAARLMSGNLALYDQLEKAIARLISQETALVFGSGYTANVGIIPALVGRNDVIFADRLNHASLYDGCLLSGARLVRFRHNDPNHLETLLQRRRGKGQALIVAESIYSMDGDRCPIRDLVSLKKRYSCQLMIDEAHAIGIFGDHGGGVIEAEGVAADIDIAMGTFGKALGSYGAYAGCTGEMAQYLINKARSFIYSTGLPPAVLGASLAAVEIVRDKPLLRQELHRKITFFKSCLEAQGITGLGPSQIVPVHIGASKKAVELAAGLRQQQIFATAIRPPTVPEGTARIRFSITRHHSEEDLQQAADALLRQSRMLGITISSP